MVGLGKIGFAYIRWTNLDHSIQAISCVIYGGQSNTETGVFQVRIILPVLHILYVSITDAL
jgi:hypothetical protein